MLDHYFSNHGLKESIATLTTVSARIKIYWIFSMVCYYWMTRGNYLSFMEVGHSRCLVDGLIKKMYRRLDCDTMQHLEETVRRSSRNQLYTWEWRNWDQFINSLFKAVTGIRKYHHFKSALIFQALSKQGKN